MAKKDNAQILVCAYGFNRIGYKIGDAILTETKNLTIKSIVFESDEKLDKADGLIIPQGIFEEVEYRNSIYGLHGEVTYKKELMLEREREILNHLREAKWVCFLVGEIVDFVPDGINSDKEVSFTDLCKKALNNIGVRRHNIDGVTTSSIANEFQSYIRDYGVAKTLFDLPYDALKHFNVIAKANDHCAGFDLDNLLFFLPFHTTKFDNKTFLSLVSIVANSILEYRKKYLSLLPKWMEDFNFKNEVETKQKISELKEQILALEEKLIPYQNYKLIMNTSGENLKEKTVQIFENYFGLRIDPIDKGREDATILDDNDKIIAMIEIKGTNKGIKREHINQVDSHRERNDLPSEVPGILIINNEMNLEGLEERLKTTVPAEHIKHAVNNNVLIVRTIDFLYFMKHLEEENEFNRKTKFLEIIESGGGWLNADQEGYRVITE